MRLLIAYALIGIITFGHSASNGDLVCAKSVDPIECSALGGLFSGVFWPFYWSWFSFDEIGGQE